MSNARTACLWIINGRTDLVSLWIKEEVGPVRIGLHVSELKQLPQAQVQDLLTNLTEEKRKGAEESREDSWSCCKAVTSVGRYSCYVTMCVTRHRTRGHEKNEKLRDGCAGRMSGHCPRTSPEGLHVRAQTLFRTFSGGLPLAAPWTEPAVVNAPDSDNLPLRSTVMILFTSLSILLATPGY
uniref:Uncharacterized protein n=1 Tax=Scophthalmus maximus TaxID=52904 RepID=A0A8D3AM74_SCOMX